MDGYDSPFGNVSNAHTDSLNPYENLANAIIMCAVDDYRRKRRNPKAKVSSIRSLEYFFRSDYFRVLSNVDPEIIINYLSNEELEDYQ